MSEKSEDEEFKLHRSKAIVGMKGTEQLSYDEKLIVIKNRIMRYAQIYCNKNGNVDSFSDLDNVMCALQHVVNTKD